MDKTPADQNGDTKTATEMAIVKNGNKSTVGCTHIYGMLSYMKKYNIPSRAMPDVSAQQI